MCMCVCHAGVSSVHVDSAHSNPLHHTHTDTDTVISFTDLSEALSRALQAPAVLAPKPTTATTSSAAHAAQHMSAAQGTGTAGEAAGSGGGTGCVWPEAAWRLGAPLLSSGSEEALGLLYVLVTQNSAYQVSATHTHTHSHNHIQSHTYRVTLHTPPAWHLPQTLLSWQCAARVCGDEIVCVCVCVSHRSTFSTIRTCPVCSSPSYVLSICVSRPSSHACCSYVRHCC